MMPIVIAWILTGLTMGIVYAVTLPWERKRT